MADSDVGMKFFSDKVGPLLEKCLDIINEFFIEDLIETLNEIIKVFYEEITPFSIAICEKLSDAYADIRASLGDDVSEMEEAKSISTANGCITAICRVARSISETQKDDKKQVLIEIENKVHGVLLNSLDIRFKDVHESIMICLNTF